MPVIMAHVMLDEVLLLFNLPDLTDKTPDNSKITMQTLEKESQVVENYDSNDYDAMSLSAAAPQSKLCKELNATEVFVSPSDTRTQLNTHDNSYSQEDVGTDDAILNIHDPYASLGFNNRCVPALVATTEVKKKVNTHDAFPKVKRAKGANGTVERNAKGTMLCFFKKEIERVLQ